MKKNENYIQRCFDLSKLGIGHVSPNPPVGAVLVYQDKIIGEGYHKAYGLAHAEVNALNSVAKHNRHLIPKSTLYVSLEPCSITGKTPPCTTLIIQNDIKEVVFSAIDYTPGVFQKSQQILTSNDIKVKQGILAKEGQKISAIREKIIHGNYPYVILKYAQTKDYFIGKKNNKQFWISNAFTKRLVHKWRSEVDAILVGTHTALIDNPTLTTRYYFGKSPVRVLIDRQLSVPDHYNIFNGQAKTLVFNQLKNNVKQNITWVKLDFSQPILPQLLRHLHQENIASLLVEGGAKTLQAFIDQNLWDEARITTGNKYLKDGIPAPAINSTSDHSIQIADDKIDFFYNSSN